MGPSLFAAVRINQSNANTETVNNNGVQNEIMQLFNFGIVKLGCNEDVRLNRV